MARPMKPRLVALWRDRIARQAKSGLTIVQFCVQEGCARSAFQRWKRYFQTIDDSDPPPTVPAPKPRAAPPAPSNFLPVAVRIVDNKSPEPRPVEVDLPNGIQLRIPTADHQLACRLVRVVAAAKTYAGGSR